jgi:2-methylcitrate dehydratase PrpD
VEATLNLVCRHGPFDVGKVARVDSWTHKRALMHTDRPEPASGLEAKFSVQYCVARALMDGKVVLDHFGDDAWREPAVRDLLKRVHAAPYTGKLFAADDPFDAEVKITLTDGTTYSDKVDRPLGRSSNNAIATEDMKAKFADCASRVLTPQAATEACGLIDRFEDLGSMREFTKLFEPAGTGTKMTG